MGSARTRSEWLTGGALPPQQLFTAWCQVAPARVASGAGGPPSGSPRTRELRSSSWACGPRLGGGTDLGQGFAPFIGSPRLPIPSEHGRRDDDGRDSGKGVRVLVTPTSDLVKILACMQACLTPNYASASPLSSIVRALFLGGKAPCVQF